MPRVTVTCKNGDRQRKREGGQNGDLEDKRRAGREGGRAGDVEDKRKAGREGGRTGGRSSGLARTGAALRRHGHDDMQLSPRRPAFRAVHLVVTVSIGRKVGLFAKKSN